VIKELFYKERFVFLIATILLYLLATPFLSGFLGLRLLLDLLLSAILLSGVYAVSENRNNTLIAAFLALPMFISIWISHMTPDQNLILLVHLFALPYLLFTIVIILIFIFKIQKVTRDVIAASIVVYLLIGLLWTFVYMALNLLNPGSFSYNEIEGYRKSYRLSYFSFVTLTTLGYGDITPLTPQARAFAYIEAIIGQMYIAVLIARLVGLQVAQAMSRRNKQDK
jgi:Ion channel